MIHRLQFIMMRFFLLFIVSSLCKASVISTSDAKLPMSLSSIISDLEAEGCDEVQLAMVLSSRSTTKEQINSVLTAVVQDEASAKAVGTQKGLCVAQPEASEVGLTASCLDTLVYVPDVVDLSRGEGLFDTLAPAMEKLLNINRPSTLLVVIPDNMNAKQVQSQLEKAAESVVQHLISERPIRLLEDVFERVHYVNQDELAAFLAESTASQPMEATSRIAESVDLETMLWSSSPSSSPVLSSTDLAAARKLGPAARKILQRSMQTIRAACQADDGSLKYVADFGQLCAASMAQAMEQLEEPTLESSGISQSSVAKQIRSNLRSDLEAAMGDVLEEELELLQAYSFDEFRKGMSKLLISPNLATDMAAFASKSVTDFGKAAKRLVVKGTNSNVQPAIQRFQTQVKDFCEARLLAAQSSGQFKPLPRKGVTVGFHWLLPKPFGNDFRQEPWMVHASDNMVYVPPDKLTDVSPEEVLSGDWRNKIVPSPAGNDMLYMQ